MSSPEQTEGQQEDSLRLMREAAELGRHCEGVWRDLRESTDKESEIAYAVDADVVVLFSAPDKHAEYGRVFSDADPKAHLAAAAVLGDFIVQRWPAVLEDDGEPEDGRLGGLIILPPHDQELRRIGMRIAHLAIAQRTPAPGKTGPSDAALAEIRNVLAGAPKEKQAEALYSELQRLGLIPGAGHATTPIEELHRLEELPEGRLVALRDHPWFVADAQVLLPPRTSEVWARATLGEGSSDSRTKEFVTSVDQWHQRLLAAWSGSLSARKGRSVLDDAQALARLEWINRHLATSGRRRLALITGTSRLFDVASQVAAAHQGFDNFAAAYLRSPRAFFGAKDVLSDVGGTTLESRPFDAQRTELRVADWLSVLFPNHLKQGRFEGGKVGIGGSTVRISFSQPSEGEMVEAMQAHLDAPEGLFGGKPFPSGALEQWVSALRTAHERQQWRGEQQRKSSFAKEVAGLLGDDSNVEVAINQLVGHLRQRELSALVKLYGLTDVIGVVQLLAPEQKMKGLPALRFDPGFEAAQDECDKLCDLMFRPRGEGRPSTFDPVAMFGRLHQMDTSNYHSRVLLAYVFACTAKWFQVRTLCYVALLTVDSIRTKEPKDKRDGREAAYLLAVAERRLAINTAGVEHARQALAEARARDRRGPDLRFEVEDFAQRMVRVQLETYFGQGQVDHGDVANELQLALDFAARAKVEERGVIRRWVARQSLTMGLILAVLARAAEVKPAPEAALVQRILDVLQNDQQAPTLTTSEPEQRYPDAVSDFVWLVATNIFAADQSRRENARLALEREYRWPSEEPPPTPVERARHKHFLKIVGIEPGQSGAQR